MISEKPYTISSIINILFKRKTSNPFDKHQKYFMGRDALSHAIELCGINETTKVLLPAYSCLEVITPFKKINAKMYFYDVRENLKLDVESIVNQIKENEIEAFLFINYFGQVNKDILRIKNLCAHTLIFIEDTTHSLLSKESGLIGNVIFGSFRKVLPVPDGAYLIHKCKVQKPKYKSRIISDFISLIILIKSLSVFKKINLNRTNISRKFKSTAKKEVKYLRISRTSNSILTRIEYEKQCKLRRKNYLIWENKLKKYGCQSIISPIDDGTIPSGYPILINQRDKVVQYLETKKIFIKVDWPKDQLYTKQGEYSNFLSENIITLPVNENIDDKKIEFIIFCISNVIGDNWKLNIKRNIS